MACRDKSLAEVSAESDPENRPTSSFRSQVEKAWVGFGFTSESECEVLGLSNQENKENDSMSANRSESKDISLQASFEDNSLPLFLEESQVPIESSSAQNATQSTPGLDDSVMVISPSPKREPSCINISDSFQEEEEEELKLELSQTQTQSDLLKESPLASSRSKESQLSEILGPNSLLNANTDIDQMIADDDDVQNMSNIIDFEDNQAAENYKDDSIDYGLLMGQRLDFNVMSPLKEFRRHGTGSPLKIKDLTISPLKARKDPPPSDIDSEDRRKLAVVAGQKQQQDNGDVVLRKEQDNSRSDGQLKRKAGEALSSEDESRKKINNNDIEKKEDIVDSSQSATTTPLVMNSSAVLKSPSPEIATENNEVNREKEAANTESPILNNRETPEPVDSRTTSYSTSRPHSRAHLTDISCSPIVGSDEGSSGSGHNTVYSKERKTSTPGHKALSSPQKMLRKKLVTAPPNLDTSEEENAKEVNKPPDNQDDGGGKDKDVEEELDDTPKLEEPSPRSQSGNMISLDIVATDAENLKAVEAIVEQFKTKLQEAGARLFERPRKLEKRLSDVSSLSRSSSGASSGYLAGSSSNASSSEGSKRSRLSMNPDVVIERHKIVGKLPKLLHSTFHAADSPSSQESVEPQNGSQELKTIEEELPQSKAKPDSPVTPSKEKEEPKEEDKEDELEECVKQEKQPRSRKESGNRNRDSARKKYVKKKSKRRMEDTDEEEEEREKEGEEQNSANSDEGLEILKEATDLLPGEKVFGRWTDPAGVYFYAATVLKIISNTDVKVRFLEDKIERVLKIESEMINVTALHPHDEVTVKHDILEVYDVTAKLMSFPTRTPKGDVQYEVQLLPSDSEPQLNEDSRTVHFSEVSLTDNQASLIIRRMGFVPASNKVSADINFGNLIFGKRKPRTVNSSPGTTPNKVDSPSGVTPSKKSARRKRGGSNVEESQSTEASASEISTPRSKKSLKPLLDEDQDNKSLSKRAKKNTSANNKSSATNRPVEPIDPNMFQGMCFVFTQAKYSMPMTDAEDTESETERTSRLPKFDKSKLRALVTAGGGRILQNFPSQEDLIETVNEEIVTVADRMCLTMTYLLSLANSVPIISFMYLEDCETAGRKLDYRPAYLLPAGSSSLLMMEVEQGQDCKTDLQMNGCLLPSPPATSTRLSNKSKEVESSPNKKILSGLHVLVLTKEKTFADDWQSVLDSIGARVTKRTSNSSRLAQIRVPDVVLTDKSAPSGLVQDLRKREDIPVVSTNWAIQCIVNNARVAFDNFSVPLPKH